MTFKKYNTKNITFFIIGSIMIGIALALFTGSLWGADPLTSIFGLVYQKQQFFTQGMIINIISMIMILIVALIDYKELGLGTIAAPFIVNAVVDLVNKVITFSNNRMENIIYLPFGLILLSLGAAFCIVAGIGKSAYDSLIMAIANKFKTSYSFIRYPLDIIFAIIVLILGGTIGIWNILVIFLVGPLVDLFIWLIKKFLY